MSGNFLQMSITVDLGIFTILLVFVKGHFALSPQGLYWRLFPILDLFLSNQRRKKVRCQYYYICFGWFIWISTQKTQLFQQHWYCVFFSFRKGDLISASNFERPSFYSDRLIQSKRLLLFFEVDASPLHTAWSISSCAGVTWLEQKQEQSWHF